MNIFKNFYARNKEQQKTKNSQNLDMEKELISLREENKKLKEKIEDVETNFLEWYQQQGKEDTETKEVKETEEAITIGDLK